jgi:hypothetical protein
MREFINAVEIFSAIINRLEQRELKIDSPLDEIVLRSCQSQFAYVDERDKAKNEYNVDFWKGIRIRFKNEDDFLNLITSNGVKGDLLYSRSEQFPDFLFKLKTQDDELCGGSILELKDSKGGSIASFNSTIPTKYKSLDELNKINGNDLILKIASIMDGKIASREDYHSFQRRCLYFIRTNRNNNNKIKLSIVDGSFFETVSKEQLFQEMFMNILNKEGNMPEKLIKELREYIPSDQTIVAASQDIIKASIKPRLRVMAEVHTEGNPHSSSYPEIKEKSFNLILQESGYSDQIKAEIESRIHGTSIDMFIIKHKRNGNHIVFRYFPS